MARSRFLRKLGRAAADRAAEAVASGIGKTRQTARDLANGGRFTCSCGGRSCPGTFRTLRGQKAHAAKMAAGRWTSAKARAVGRKMGKEWDNARRHARAFREAAGLIDPRGQRTARARSRPEVAAEPGKVTPAKNLRHASHHDRDHEKADHHDRKADEHKARAARHQARAEARTRQGKPPGRHERRQERHKTRAQRHQDKAAGRRDRWPEQPTPAPAPRPAPARPAPKTRDNNSSRPAPARPAPTGRLAPQPRANGHRPPEPAGRTPR